MLCALFAFKDAHSKLLDKTLAVIDSELLTLSDAEQILSNIDARRNISPQIYSKKKYDTEDVINNFIRKFIIRKNLSNMGFVISRLQVEAQIKETESNLKINREELLQFLGSNNISFNEYFDITKETIEYNIFLARIIKPLIKITDYELKNKFSKNTKLSSNTFNYTLVDFYVSKKSVSKSKLKTIRGDLIKFQKEGVLPNYLKNLETNVLNNVKEDGLASPIKKALIGIDVEKFSNPVEIGNHIHLFYIKNKSIVESEKFSTSKRKIEQEIFISKSLNVINKWLDQEKTKYYIKIYL